MTKNNPTSARVAVVRSIGAAESKTADVAAQIVAAAPAEYNWTARGAVPAAILSWVTDGNPDAAPAQKTGGKGDQTITNFGRGVDKLRKAVAALVREDKPKPVRMAVTMSGDDAPVTGTVEISPEAHPDLYAALLDLIAGAAGE